MKRTLLILICLVMLKSTAWSQFVVLKPGAGINFAGMTRDQYGYKYAKAGFEAGGSVSIGKRFYAEPGLFYLRKNIGYSVYPIFPILSILGNMQPYKKISANTRLSGVQIPLALGYRIIDKNQLKTPWGLRLFAGGSTFFIRSPDKMTDFKNIQWGIFAGFGLDVAFLFLDAKYEWSVSDEQQQTYVDRLGRSKTIYLNLGVRIPLKK